MVALNPDRENPTLDELRYYYSAQKNLAEVLANMENSQEFLINLIIGADREIASGKNIASNLRFKSVAEPLVG